MGMKLLTVTITGASDDVDPHELIELSQQYPWLEWGILLSSSAAGIKPRYPSLHWLAKLQTTLGTEEFPRRNHGCRLAAHLCGDTMRSFMTGITRDGYSPSWHDVHGITEMSYDCTFNRTQVNFNARREGYSPKDMDAMLDGWYETMSGNLITQHNSANDWVWEVLQRNDKVHGSFSAHQVLHDASGGRGVAPGAWPRPIAGVVTGYAGGINPGNVIQVLYDVQATIGDGYTWIDMESGVRTEDDRMNMPAIRHMLAEIAGHIQDNKWV